MFLVGNILLLVCLILCVKKSFFITRWNSPWLKNQHRVFSRFLYPTSWLPACSTTSKPLFNRLLLHLSTNPFVRPQKWFQHMRFTMSTVFDQYLFDFINIELIFTNVVNLDWWTNLTKNIETKKLSSGMFFCNLEEI